MADVKPLKLEYAGDGTPSGIGEFTSGDTIESAIVDLSLPELTDVNSSLSPTTVDSLVYTGSNWNSSSITHPDTFSIVKVSTTLSAGPNCTVDFDQSSITVSSCPVPPPWSFVEVTSDDGVDTADPFYFASGSSQSTTEIDVGHITWNSSESYFTIATAGYYEFEMQGSVTVAASPTDITTSIVQTTGYGGTEIEKIDKLERIRTNIDPHDIMIKWMGYCIAAVNFTCKLDATAAVQMNKGSTFTCKRIN